ncbi:response regulator transcription factor [Novosphingobium taihuense]|uniref:Two-component system KDP operon response regulator KdpE n=1 Tax=Novosphingobium taihuense TaxID=260085 RepID=A0A7W7EVF3_9SPHN|nr:response regulator transcription factor [Novosphingobium taihuense]MBB4613175.1 two-component system KDP operon response regulator KdpE [Novosphingobium taihuense]TWH85316.1 two-component system KDP operon response regulator KdpE [Novosphingobium taihuense]
MSRIMCIDDEPAILRLLEVVLRRGGHEVLPAVNARAALAALAQGPIDAVLLDLGLPDRDGLELLGLIRARCDAPVVVVSARGEVQEKVTALDLGASDYVTKPFDGDELLARLRVALRGSGRSITKAEVLEHGPLSMDIPRHETRISGKLVALTPKEFAVLQALVEADGRVVTHGALLESVWGKAHRDDVEYLRVVIRALRLKIEEDPARPQFIRNEPGIGYRLS